MQVPALVPASILGPLGAALERGSANDGARRKNGAMYARRSLLSTVPEVARLARSAVLVDLASELLGSRAVAVKGTLFDKRPEANWRLRWHQDRVIAVVARREVPGFGPWSVKDGICHVQAPAEVLARMIALRLHLDPCDSGNGALRVVPGSHRRGKLSRPRVAEELARRGEVLCTAAAGDVLALAPLLLHASSPAQVPRRRRVVHVEYAAGELPGGLQWFSA